MDNRVARRKIDIVAENDVEKIDNAWALDCQSTVIGAAIGKRDIVRAMLLQPAEVFICACRVYHQEKFLRSGPINDQVVDDSAAFVQQEGILARADFEFLGVISEHLIEPGARGRARCDQLAHM